MRQKKFRVTAALACLFVIAMAPRLATADVYQCKVSHYFREDWWILDVFDVDLRTPNVHSVTCNGYVRLRCEAQGASQHWLVCSIFEDIQNGHTINRANARVPEGAEFLEMSSVVGIDAQDNVEVLKVKCVKH